MTRKQLRNPPSAEAQAAIDSIYLLIVHATPAVRNVTNTMDERWYDFMPIHAALRAYGGVYVCPRCEGNPYYWEDSASGLGLISCILCHGNCKISERPLRDDD
jgi:hypothetical protein